jgi:biopolymer transport protein ExbD
MEIALPTGGESAYMETIGVITVQSEKFIMFNGNIFSLDTLELGIRKYLRKKNATNFAGNIVLLRPDKSLPVDALIKVCEIAKRAGYSGVQIASKPLVPR